MALTATNIAKQTHLDISYSPQSSASEQSLNNQAFRTNTAAGRTFERTKPELQSTDVKYYPYPHEDREIQSDDREIQSDDEDDIESPFTNRNADPIHQGDDQEIPETCLVSLFKRVSESVGNSLYTFGHFLQATRKYCNDSWLYLRKQISVISVSPKI